MARRHSTLEPHAQALLCYFTCPAPPRDIGGHSGPRHLLLRRGAAEGGTSHFSCPRALVMGTRRLQGTSPCARGRQLRLSPFTLAPGEEEGQGGQGPGGRAPPQLAALSLVAGPRQPCLHLNNVPSVQRPGTHYMVLSPHPGCSGQGAPCHSPPSETPPGI